MYHSLLLRTCIYCYLYNYTLVYVTLICMFIGVKDYKQSHCFSFNFSWINISIMAILLQAYKIDL